MKFLKYTLWTVAAILLAFVAAALVVNAALPGREKKLNDAWGKTLVSLDDLPRQFPKTENNASALAVEKLSAALGICLVPSAQDAKCARALPAGDAVKNFDEVKGLTDYVNAQLEKGGDTIDPPPEGLQKYLAGHTAELAAMRDQLRGNDPPHWGYDPGQGFNMALPNFLGQMNLQKLLLADALDALRLGQADRAEASLTASLRLDAETGRNPTLISQLIANAVTRMQSGVARKFPQPPAVWSERFKGAAPLRDMALSFEFEAWGMQHTILTSDSKTLKAAADGDSKSGLDLIPDFMQRAYLRLSVAETSEAMRVSLEKYLPLDPCQVAARKPDEAEIMAGLSWWNVLGKIAVPNTQSAWARASRAALEIEMTRKLFEVKQQRDPDGAWPKSVAGIGDSACKAAKWDYQVAADGSMTLAFSPKVEWGDNLKGPKIPLAVTLKAPAHS